MSSLADFKVVKFLGQGSYGSVYKVLRRSDGKNYALKQVKIRYMSQTEREEALNEVRILASVKHPAIIRYCDSFYEKDKLYIITDFAESGDLTNELKRRKTFYGKFEEDTLWSYFIQLVIGMCELHKRKILHRDLKCQNIFLTAEKNIKIGDLGVAKLLKAGLTKTQVGTPYYISPEIWRKLPYNHKSDVWSLGCVLYELATFRHPFLADSPKGLAAKIMTGKYPSVSGYSSDLVDVIKRLLVVEASRRPSMEEILQLPTVKRRMHLVPSHLRESLERSSSRPQVQIIGTIKVPRNLGLLKQNLPNPSYPTPQPPQVKKFFTSPPKKTTSSSPKKTSFDVRDKPKSGAVAPVRRRSAAVPERRQSAVVPERRQSAAPRAPKPSAAGDRVHRVARNVPSRPVSSPGRLQVRASRVPLKPKNVYQADKPQYLAHPPRLVAKPLRVPLPKGKENVKYGIKPKAIEVKANYLNVRKPAVDPLERLNQVAAEIERIRQRRKALQEMNRRMENQLPIPQLNYRNRVRRY